jgi:hypothetical protein
MRYDSAAQAALTNPLGWILLLLLLGALLVVSLVAVLGALAVATHGRSLDTRWGPLPWLGSAQR